MDFQQSFKGQTFIRIDSGIADALRRNLKKGERIRGRIVYRLANNRYVMRISGHNLVMQSNRPFERFDEIDFKVLRVSPRLMLRFVRKFQNAKTGQNRLGSMNIEI